MAAGIAAELLHEYLTALEPNASLWLHLSNDADDRATVVVV